MKTLLMVKPDTVAEGHYGDIIAFVLRNRFDIERLRMLRMDRAMAEEFYAVHRERDFYGALVDYMTSGRLVAMEINGDEDIIQQIRTFIGPTNPVDATPGTVRHMFGKSLQNNAVHASDSPESAKKELAIVFGDS